VVDKASRADLRLVCVLRACLRLPSGAVPTSCRTRYRMLPSFSVILVIGSRFLILVFIASVPS